MTENVSILTEQAKRIWSRPGAWDRLAKAGLTETATDLILRSSISSVKLPDTTIEMLAVLEKWQNLKINEKDGLSEISRWFFR